jgi:hypothetical protein
MYKAIALTAVLITSIYLLLLWAAPLPEIKYPCPIHKHSLPSCGVIR